MDKLPQEIIDKIAHELSRSLVYDGESVRVSSYATISKKWQKTVESILFRSLKIQDIELSSMGEIIAKRWQYIQSICYQITLVHEADRYLTDRLSLREYISVKELLDFINATSTVRNNYLGANAQMRY